MKKAFQVTMLLLAIPLTMFLNALTIRGVWNMYMVPFGHVEMTLASSFGFAFYVSILANHEEIEKEGWVAVQYYYGVAIFRPLIVGVVAYLVGLVVL